MTLGREVIKRGIGNLYSWSADRIYEPLVVHRAFPLLGGDLNDLALEQGRRAVATAGGRPLLDMPVGTAFFTVAAAAAHEGLVVGADLAAGMVRRAKRAGAEAGLDNLVAVRADSHHLPFAEGSFGAILCTNGLQVIPGLEETVAELARVLAPGACLFVSIITMPVAAALPPGMGRRLPTLLKSRRELVVALTEAGLALRSVRSQRFASLIEAIKPVAEA
ncbi:MAG: class I SAM-dependent methyltransferase [Actinomycetota bacterium]